MPERLADLPANPVPLRGPRRDLLRHGQTQAGTGRRRARFRRSGTFGVMDAEPAIGLDPSGSEHGPETVRAEQTPGPGKRVGSVAAGSLVGHGLEDRSGRGRQYRSGPEPEAQAERRFRPRARRALMMARPERVAMRARNPWRRARFSLLGWKVRFMICFLGSWPFRCLRYRRVGGSRGPGHRQKRLQVYPLVPARGKVRSTIPTSRVLRPRCRFPTHGEPARLCRSRVPCRAGPQPAERFVSRTAANSER